MICMVRQGRSSAKEGPVRGKARRRDPARKGGNLSDQVGGNQEGKEQGSKPGRELLEGTSHTEVGNEPESQEGSHLML